mgnify:CR=1 FL=1|tara:strand:- start:175 stop:384 length:210 start_codon:yes stop_codon:yes gene_type:complete
MDGPAHFLAAEDSTFSISKNADLIGLTIGIIRRLKTRDALKELSSDIISLNHFLLLITFYFFPINLGRK